MRSRYNMSLALVLIVAALGGCTSAVFQQPEVTIQNVELAGLGLTGGTLIFNLEVVNPNRFALNATELRYDLEIADTRLPSDTTWLDLAGGTFTEAFSVGAGDTGIVSVPVEFTYAGLGGAAGSILRAGTFNYRATGTVDVRTPIGSRSVPFRRNGMVTLVGAR